MYLAFSSLQILAWLMPLAFVPQIALGKPSAQTWPLESPPVTGALVSLCPSESHPVVHWSGLQPLVKAYY